MKKKRNRYLNFILQAHKSRRIAKKNLQSTRDGLVFIILFPLHLTKNIFLIVRLFYFQLLYFAHLRLRYVHDILYKDNKTYKKVNDYKYTRPIRRATVLGFVLSFVVFQLLGNLWPEAFNPIHPKVAEGAATTVVWTAQGDFENNNITKGSNTWDTTRSGVDTSSSPGAVKIATKPTVYNVQPTGNITTDSTTITAQYAPSSSGIPINTGSVVVNLDGSPVAGCTVTSTQVSCPVTGLTGDANHNISVSASDNGGSTATGAGSFKTPYITLTTLNIDNTVTGGNCALVGTWNQGTQTCTMTKDVYNPNSNTNGIVISINNATLNGSGHTLTGTQMFNSGVSVTIRNNTTIKNIKIKGYRYGVYGCCTSNTLNIVNNTFIGINNGDYGVYLSNTSNVSLYNNNFLNTTSTINNSGGTNNTFNQALPNGGNFYDIYSTPGQGCNDANSDGFCDSAYSFTGGSDSYPWKTQNGWAPTVTNVQPSGNITSSSTTVTANYSANAGATIDTNSVVVKVDGTTLTGCTVTSGNVSCPASGLAGDTTHTISGSVADSTGRISPISGTFTVNLNSYNTLGTLGGANNSDIGLRVDAGANQKTKWNNIDFALNGSLASGQGVKFLIKTSDDGSNWTIYDRNGATVTAGNLEAALTNTYYGQVSGGTNYSSVSAFVPASRFADLIVRLISDGSNTPSLDSVTLGYNSLENPINSNLTLTKTTGGSLKTSTGLTVGAGVGGAWTNEAAVNLTASGLTCTGCGSSTNIRPQVERKPVGSAFDGSTDIFTASPGSTTANITGLVAGTSYHIQVRAIDDQGRSSAWVSYGGNAELEADFTVDQIAPPAVSTLATTSPAKTTSLTWGTVSDLASGTSYYNVYRSGTLGQLGTKISTDGAVTTGVFTESPADGTYYYTIQAVDNAGNEQLTGNNQVTEVIDNNAPASFTLASPPNGTWQQSTSPTLSWNASSDANGLAKYQLYIDGALSRDSISSVATSTTPGSALAIGNHTWYVKAYDNAGNITQSNTYNVGYDNAAETPTVLGATSSYTNKVRVTWTDSSINAPSQTFEIQRVKKADYDAHGWTNTSDWSIGDGYAAFTFPSSTLLFDDSTTIQTQGQILLDPSVKYVYRIRAVDQASNISGWSTGVTGMTLDAVPPTNPSVVSATACDGTVGNCSPGGTGNKGFEIKLAWTAAVDSGTGVTGYKIYRAATNSINQSDFTLVGYLDVPTPGAPINTVYYDNDANNAATFTDTINDVPATVIKGSPSAHLNDFVNYYYRVTSIDAAGNETSVITTDGMHIPDSTNYATAKTVDVTAPSTPQNTVATPLGLDSSGNHQRVDITWGASTDVTGRDANVNGSDISGYKVMQCMGNFTTCSDDNNFSQIGTSASTSFTIEGLNEFTQYFYKIIAVDKASSATITDTGNNNSARSVGISATTASNTVPTVPTSVTVTTKTGDPGTDSNIGHQNTVTFAGSYAKNCAANVRCITGYEIYRSTDNFVSNSLKVADISVNPVGDERAVTYTYVDNNASNDSTAPSISRTSAGSPTVSKSATAYLTDATTYYYKVKAKDNTPSVPDGGPFISGLSAVSTGSLHSGWDTTADATAPEVPQAVAVKDIHPNDSMVRNIITWTMISDPTRNGTSDFKKYQVYRYETLLGPGSAALVSEQTDRGQNFFVDGISNSSKDKDYSYYVVAVDNAGTDFKYSTGTIINNTSNVSGHLAAVSITPGAVNPTVSAITVTSTGVSSGTINWTTNQTTDSLVEYRVKGSNDVIAAGKDRTQPTTSHSINLNSLSKGTTYEYRIVSRNSLGNIDETAASTWKEFSTQDFSISNPQASTTTTTATITWTTNGSSDSYVEYKLERAPGEADEKSQVAGDSTMSTSHSVAIKDLKPDRTYTYKIRSVTGDKYISETAFMTFRTRANDLNQFSIAPAETSVSEQNVTATTAQITWVTTSATTSWVEYGTEPGVYSMTAGDNDFNTLHAVKLMNLRPGTKYYYRVKGADQNQIEFFSPESSFTAILMPEISNLTARETGPYNAVITFDTNVDTVVTVNYGKDTGYGSTSSVAKAEKNHVINLKDLEDNSAYHLQVSALDQFKNEVKSADISFNTPLDTQGPEISEVKVDVLPIGDSTDTASAIISWTSDKPSTTQVEYDDKGAGDKYENHSVENPSLDTSHTVMIKDLNTSSNYRFRIVAKDKRGNLTKTKASTFITPTKEKSLLQIIIKSFEDTFSWTRNIPTVLGKIGNRLLGR